jgi:DNA polymerase III epsilon subunit family exonuclease
VQGFAVLDLETTGLSSYQDRIVEVSVVYFDKNGREEFVYSTLVNPNRKIPPQASAVNGISDSMVSKAPTFTEISGRILENLADRVLVGHNISSFDVPFLVNEFASAGISWQAGSILDTLYLARKAYPSLKSHRLSELCKLAGIKNTQAHRAESDARATWQLLCTLAADDVDDLLDLDKYELPIFDSAVPSQLVARRPIKAKPDLNLKQTCAGEVVVFTGGKPPGYTNRNEARDAVVLRGGRATTGVTKSTTVVFAGDNAGSKLDKARELGILVLPHASFADFLDRGRSGIDAPATAHIRRFDGNDDIVGEVKLAIDERLTDTAPPEPSQIDIPSSSSVQPNNQNTALLENIDQMPPPSLGTLPPPSMPPPNYQSPPIIPASQFIASKPQQARTAVLKEPVLSYKIATVLAIFLGVFGAHRFYYGYKKRGLIMLATSIISCGILAPVVLLIAWWEAYKIGTYRLLPNQ